MRATVCKRGESWIVTLGDDEFECATEADARELASDFNADLAGRYVELEP